MKQTTVTAKETKLAAAVKKDLASLKQLNKAKKLQGEDYGDGVLCYDHLFNTDMPTRTQYKAMVHAARADQKVLNSAGVVNRYHSGNSGNDIGLPYIDIISIATKEGSISA